MKKLFLYSLIILVAFGQGILLVSAKTNMEAPLKIAIKKYKSGNYAGCLQDCLNLVIKDPSNAAAYYYLAISYVQVGKKEEALECYSRVLSLNQNKILTDYAKQGKTCLESPEECASNQDELTELDKFLDKPSSTNFSNKVMKALEQKNLDNIKNDINNAKKIDTYKIKKLTNFSNKKSQIENDNEITAALKLLSESGINLPIDNNQKSMMENDSLNSYTANKNNEIEQLNILMGEGNNQKNSNLMLNMLPFIMAQNNNEARESYSPQLMQAVIMNSMMPDFTFNSYTNEE